MMIQPDGRIVETHASGLVSDVPKLDPRERHFRIGVADDLHIFLRHLGPASTPGAPKIVHRAPSVNHRAFVGLHGDRSLRHQAS
jgi:hypothetical protein